MGKSILNKTIVHFFIIAILSLIAYSNTFKVPFLFDDDKVIVTNPIIKDLKYFTDPSKAKIFKGHFGYHTFRSRYIGYLTFALNYKLNGLDVAGYHIVNLLIHICTSLFIYFLVILTFKTPFMLESRIKDYSVYIAFFTALLFACHPVQTEAVTYIWQRVTSLAAMLYVISLAAYAKWRLSVHHSTAEGIHNSFNTRYISFYLISIISAIFAMKTKQIAFTLPVIIVLYESLFFGGKLKKRIMYIVPFLLTLPIIPLTLIDIGKPFGDLIGDVMEATRDLTEMSRLDYLFTEFRVITTYIRLIFLPVKQNLDYDYPVYRSLSDPEVFLSFVFLVLIFGAGIYLLYRCRKSAPHIRLVVFGILWLYVTLSVESSIIPIANVICEYRMYLPSIGVFIATSTLIFMAVEWLGKRWKNPDKSIIGALILIAIVLTGATYSRNKVWENDVSLWGDVIRKSPGKARGYNNLGMWHYKSGQRRKAIPFFKKAISLNYNNSNAHNNLGLSYMGEEMIDQAVEEFQKAIRIRPYNGMYHINLGIAYLKKGLNAPAFKEIQLGRELRRDRPSDQE